ncbi:hypothetical protein L917_20255, partial [Phytophthora nicotianae]
GEELDHIAQQSEKLASNTSRKIKTSTLLRLLSRLCWRM